MPFMLRALTAAATCGVTRRATQAKLWPAVRRAAISVSVVCLSAGSAWTIAARARAAACLSAIFAGIGVDRVDQHGHGQLAHVAVVKNAAARSYIKGALLLLFGALYEVLVAHDLKPEEAAGDGAGPDEEEEADDPEARALEGNAPGVLGAAADGLSG